MRLRSSYCDICMRRIPLQSPGALPAKYKEKDTSSSHREEDHSCITFDTPQKTGARVSATRRSAGQVHRKPQAVKLLLILTIVMSLLTFLYALVDSDGSTGPEVDPEAFFPAGTPGAQDVPSIDPVALYSADNLSITVDAAGLYYDNYAFAVTVRNETDQNIAVSSDYLCVNGYMLPSASLYEQIPAGETCQIYWEFYSFVLDEAGIEQVQQVQFYLDIYDSDEYTDIAQTGLLCLETNAPDSYVQSVDDSGRELFNEDGVRIVLKDSQVDPYGDFTMKLFIENNTDRMVDLSSVSLNINQGETGGFFWSILLPHTRAIESINFYEISELGISELSQIEQVRIEALTDYMDDRTVEESRMCIIEFDPRQDG
jgi:hypothetical protein